MSGERGDELRAEWRTESGAADAEKRRQGSPEGGDEVYAKTVAYCCRDGISSRRAAKSP